jgi:superfamily II DNA or RNA helicase
MAFKVEKQSSAKNLRDPDDLLLEQLRHWAEEAKQNVREFRSPEQRRAVEKVLDGEDLLAVMPTGYGKSLIYQFPAWLQKDSLTLVISPLRALMGQQAKMLGAGTINAHTLDRNDVWQNVANGGCFILLVSPEMLAYRTFQTKLAAALRKGRRGLGRFVVDEVHCLSDWGHDFRPHYWWVAHHLKTLEGACPRAKGLRRVPRLLLTATADKQVINDILRHFEEVRERTQQIRMSAARREIVLLAKHVRTRRERLTVLGRFLKRQAKRPLPKDVQRRGIIFNLEAVNHVDDGRSARRERMKANEVTEALAASGFKDVHTFTSKGMNKFTRDLTATAFDQAPTRKGKLTVVVATSAFGMGMDYPEIPFVVHLYPRPSLMEYWQQVGRAGRGFDPDTSWAEALAIFNSSDHTYARRFAKAPAIDGLLNAYTIPLFGWMYVWHTGPAMALKGETGKRYTRFSKLLDHLQEMGVVSRSSQSAGVPRGAMRYRVHIARLRHRNVVRALEHLRDNEFGKAKKLRKVFRYLLIAARSRQRGYITLDRTDYAHDKAGTVLTRLNRWVDIGLLSLDESGSHPGEIRLRTTSRKLTLKAIRQVQADARAWERHKQLMVQRQMDVLKAPSPRRRAQLVLRHFGEKKKVELPSSCSIPKFWAARQ